MGDTFNR